MSWKIFVLIGFVYFLLKSYDLPCQFKEKFDSFILNLSSWLT